MDAEMLDDDMVHLVPLDESGCIFQREAKDMRFGDSLVR